MLLIDTNVLSEVMKPSPSRLVVDWLNHQVSHTLFLSTISIAEICYGLHALADSDRKRTLIARFEAFVDEAFRHRILPFDEASARLYGELMARRRKSGRSMSLLDGQIAAIARSNQLAIATGNVADFDGCDCEIISPWDYAK